MVCPGAPTVQLHERQTLISPLISPEIRQRRKNRVGTLLAEGLPALPTYAIQLNSLLSSPEVDLKKVTQIVRTDPSLCAQILGLANSALFNLRRRVLAVPEAVVLLGSERLRTLVLSCAFMKFAGRQLDSDELREFWRHSLLTAMLSERIARRVEYPEAEQAYTAGLLHDIGELPLLIVAHEEEGRSDAPLAGWRDVPAVEREYFGIDHPEVSRSMGTYWNFYPSLIDVLEYHHEPNKAKQDPNLAGIVAVGDHYAGLPPAKAGEDSAEESPEEIARIDSFLSVCLPGLWEEDRSSLAVFLKAERLVPIELPQFPN